MINVANGVEHIMAMKRMRPVHPVVKAVCSEGLYATSVKAFLKSSTSLNAYTLPLDLTVYCVTNRVMSQVA